ncbi:hypothetical protein [Klebsiella aerogenes]|uniref:hypothetical protein n=1 Tax=Klebsiella aerogenes TaxID=548 RepID=UPI003752D05F
MNNKDTLFIISINFLEVVRILVDEMSAMKTKTKTKTMLVYDIPSSMAYSHARFLSKRDSIKYIIRFLMDVLFRRLKLNSITPRQTSIIRRLAEGQRQFFISDVEERSAKMISGIKKTLQIKSA